MPIDAGAHWWYNRYSKRNEVKRNENFPKRKNQLQTSSLMNSIKHLRKKLYQFSTVYFRGQKQREY